MNVKTCLKIAVITASLALGGSVSAKELRMATVVNEGSPYGDVMAAWAAEIKNRTNGEIDINIFFNGALGSQDATLRQVLRGRLDAASVSINALTTVLPEASLIQEPYLFENDAVRHCVEGVAWNEIFGPRLEEAGYVIVGTLDIGSDYIWTKSPINSVADLKGIKMAVRSAPSYERFMEDAGAIVTVLTATELVTGLKTGIVDGTITSAIYSILIGIPQLTGYATNPGTGAQSGLMGFSTRVWNNFTDTERQIIRDVSAELLPPFRKVVAGMEAALIGQAVEGGLQITELDAASIDALKASAAASRDDFLAGMGGTAVEDFAALQAAAAACAK